MSTLPAAFQHFVKVSHGINTGDEHMTTGYIKGVQGQIKGGRDVYRKQSFKELILQFVVGTRRLYLHLPFLAVRGKIRVTLESVGKVEEQLSHYFIRGIY